MVILFITFIHIICCLNILTSSGASRLEKRVCHGRAAFGITFQHKTTFSRKTRNRPMNFTMVLKYHISKILSIYSILAIFAHKSNYAGFLHGIFRNPSCYLV